MKGEYTNVSLIVQSFNGWKMEIEGVRNASFTDDSRQIIFKNRNDSLCIYKLGSEKTEYVAQVNTFKLFKQGINEWLIYQSNALGKPLFLTNLQNGITKRFNDVNSYILNKQGNSLLITRNVAMKDVLLTSVSLVSIPSGKELSIWNGNSPSGFFFDNSGTELAFISNDSINRITERRKLLWFYKQGDNKATLILNDKLSALKRDLQLSKIDHFSSDGKRLFFKAKERALPIAPMNAVMVDVWSYMDPKLQSEQLAEINDNPSGKEYLFVVSIYENKLIRLQQENEIITIIRGRDEEIVFIKSFQVDCDPLEAWSKFSRPTNHLLFTKSGRKVDIDFELAYSAPQVLSPDGNYLLLMDDKEKDLHSYELSTGVVRNLTRTLPIPICNDNSDKNKENYSKDRLLKVAAWMSNENILLYDEYDIWQLDPRGKKTAVCLTKGYGRLSKLEFKLIDEQNSYKDNIKLINPSESLLLSVFDRVRKYNGFYSLSMNKKHILAELSMSPDIFFVSTWDLRRGLRPIKLSGTNKWIVTKENAFSSPNFYYTTDFRIFKPISTIHPEKDYNWLTSSVVSFNTINGGTEQGVLYKPEDFDSAKKYPVIIHYYERLSNNANLFMHPSPISHNIEIPWFVSNGYLVFNLDIHYTYGKTGESALNSVEGAARYLKSFSWVDSSKIGIQGHSFGGFETNYIISHSHSFAAAMSSSGESDFVSAYNSLMGGALNGTASFQPFHEIAQSRMGGSLWDNPEIYINNSPVFEASQVTTPLLMMNNKKDRGVDISQGIEFFLALRRLGKRVWMLQYDDGDHTLNNKEALQHTIRMTQFFDHYLKGKAAGQWMLKGVPAKQKGIDDGLGLSDEITAEGKPVTPGRGLLTVEEQEKVDAMKHRKPFNIMIK
jgi:dienelactone hydrolase